MVGEASHRASVIGSASCEQLGEDVAGAHADPSAQFEPDDPLVDRLVAVVSEEIIETADGAAALQRAAMLGGLILDEPGQSDAGGGKEIEDVGRADGPVVGTAEAQVAHRRPFSIE